MVKNLGLVLLSLIIAYLVALVLIGVKSKEKMMLPNPEYDGSMYKSIDEYFSYNKDFLTSETVFLKFRFLNNPYGLNENNFILIYINSTLVYSGEYKEIIDLKGNLNKIFERNKRHTMEASLYVLTNKDESPVYLNIFGSKMVFEWNEKFKIIYACFAASNKSHTKLYFIPHEQIID
jgi:hypothetical protein